MLWNNMVYRVRQLNTPHLIWWWFHPLIPSNNRRHGSTPIYKSPLWSIRRDIQVPWPLLITADVWSLYYPSWLLTVPETLHPPLQTAGGGNDLGSDTSKINFPMLVPFPPCIFKRKCLLRQTVPRASAVRGVHLGFCGPLIDLRSITKVIDLKLYGVVVNVDEIPVTVERLSLRTWCRPSLEC